MRRRTLTWNSSMKRLIVGKLDLALMGRVFYIDWNMQEPGNRWRLQLGKAPLWIPMGEKPTRRGKHWAWFAKGNERTPIPGYKPWYGLVTIIEPEDKPFIP